MICKLLYAIIIFPIFELTPSTVDIYKRDLLKKSTPDKVYVTYTTLESNTT